MAKTTVRLHKLLKDNSHKVTPARLAVLALLEKTKEPLTVETIFSKLNNRKFDQVTVYRTLTTLKASGLVRQIDFQHGRAYFELASRDEHHHAVCTRCARVADIEGCCADTMEMIALKQSGFAIISQHSLEFFGLCKRCATLQPRRRFLKR